jgi:hypothetical protein
MYTTNCVNNNFVHDTIMKLMHSNTTNSLLVLCHMV